jgi:hypothetical protein
LESTYIKVFLTTYLTFATSKQVLTLLLERWINKFLCFLNSDIFMVRNHVVWNKNYIFQRLLCLYSGLSCWMEHWACCAARRATACCSQNNICSLLHMYDVFYRHNISSYAEHTGQIIW